MKYAWIKSVPDYLNYLAPDQQKLVELIGLDNAMLVQEYFAKTSIYFSDVPINALKKAWVIKNKHVHYNEAARILNISTKTVYNWRQEASHDNFELFDKEEKK